MEQELINALKAMVDQQWSAQKLPVMLSAVPRVLAGSLPEFRSVLAGKSLKMFIKETQQIGGYSLVEHPSLRAKVGVAPAGVGFEFSEHSAPRPSNERNSTRETTLAFLAVLSQLPSAEQDKVVIPASVIAKLLT